MFNARKLSFNQKWALAFILLFLPTYFASEWGAQLVGLEGATGSLLFSLIWAAISGISLCLAIAMIFFSQEGRKSWPLQIVDRFLPLVALVVTWTATAGIDALVEHNRQLRFAEAHDLELSGKVPRSVIYKRGFPDGGSAIIRSAGHDPAHFSQAVMVNLTGERIKSCKKLDERNWICYFD